MPSQSQLKHLSSLKLSKFRQKYAQFVVEGRKAVEEVFHSRWKVLGIWCTEEFAQKHGPVYSYEIMTESDNKKISSMETPPGVLAWVEMLSVEDILKQKKVSLIGESSPKFTLVLDGISDPGNLGTLIRLADWYGLSEIIASTDTVDCYNPKVLSATMGSFLRVGIRYVKLTDWLQTYTGEVFGADLTGESLYDCEIPSNSALIIGSESHGIRTELKAALQRFITIPRIGEAESLNAGIAAAIAMDNMLRKMQILPSKL
jgi:TrmH family RNA methyltransferase